MILKPTSLPLSGADASGPPLARGNAVSVLDAGGWLDLASLAPLFGSIPPDPYVPDGYRAKAVSRISLDGSVPAVGPHEPLYQDVKTNPVHGGYDRHYPPLEREMAALLGDSVRLFMTMARLPEGAEILVQAQRITTGPGRAVGHPAVEGWHQDDVDWVGILLIARSGLSGGVTLVSATGDENGIVFAQTLQAGQLLVLNDQEVWHYTTPVRDMRSRQGYRDVILFGSPSCRRAPSGRTS